MAECVFPCARIGLVSPASESGHFLPERPCRLSVTELSKSHFEFSRPIPDYQALDGRMSLIRWKFVG
jgi:hypothetical protein